MDATRAPQHHTATVNGIRMHYVTAGRGPAVLLLHGWPQTWYEWRKVMAGLAADFTVIAPDLRGFGYSAKPAAGYDAATYAADLAALCGHLGLAEVTVDLRWFFEHFAYDPSTISAADLDEYVEAVCQVGGLRAGLAVYQEFFASAGQVAEHAKSPLTIPERAFGGDACLGPLALASAQAVAPGAAGGVIERCGHWAAEERPGFVTGLVRELTGAS